MPFIVAGTYWDWTVPRSDDFSDQASAGSTPDPGEETAATSVCDERSDTCTEVEPDPQIVGPSQAAKCSISCYKFKHEEDFENAELKSRLGELHVFIRCTGDRWETLDRHRQTVSSATSPFRRPVARWNSPSAIYRVNGDRGALGTIIMILYQFLWRNAIRC